MSTRQGEQLACHLPVGSLDNTPSNSRYKVLNFQKLDGPTVLKYVSYVPEKAVKSERKP